MLLRIITFALVTILQLESSTATNEVNQACQCFDVPACPPQRLSGKSVCACVNQAELFCWRRAGIALCPSPLPYDCDNLDASGKSTRITPAAVEPATATFKATYTGDSSLNCVDLGYCFRPSRTRTTMTITMPNGTAIITVPVGLPTIAAPTSETQEPIIVFTPDANARKMEENGAPMTAPPM